MAKPRLNRLELREAKLKVRVLLEDVAEEVAGVHSSALHSLLPVLQAAEKEAEEILARWLSSAPDAAERFTAHHYRQVLWQLRRGRQLVQARVRRNPSWVATVREAVTGALTGSLRTTGAMASRHLHQEIAVFDRIFESGLAPIPIRQASIITHGEQMLIPRFERSAVRYSGAIWDDIRRQLGIGVAKNESIQALADRLEKLDFFNRHRGWANRLVRTELINAYNVQHAEGLRQAQEIDPAMQQRWDASLDSRICKICQGLHGQVAEIGEKFPGGYVHPPAHPNCRCAVVAWNKRWGTGPEEKQTLFEEKQDGAR